MKSLLTEKPVERSTVFSPRILVLLFIIFGFLMVLYSVMELMASKREQVHIMEEQAIAMITAMQKSSDNAIRSFNLVEELLAEKLLSNVRLLERMDAKGILTEEAIIQIAKENQIFRINVFDANGVREKSNSEAGRGSGQGMGLGLSGGQGMGPGRNMNSNQRLFDLLDNPETDELVIGFKQSRFSTGNRFAVAKKRRNGGAIVLNIDANDMLNFRKTIGIGRLVRDVGDSDGIEYIVLQDSTGILLASANMDSLVAIDNDPFLKEVVHSEQPKTRFTNFDGESIFEVVQPSIPGIKEVMRIGLSTRHLQEAQSSAKRRVFIASILFLVVGVMVTNWMVGNQNYSLLQNAYNKIESYTGSILTHMDESVIAINMDKRITLFNETAEKMFERPVADVLGEPCEEIIPELCDYLKKVVETGKEAHYPSLVLNINGQSRILTMSVNIVPDNERDKDIIFAVVKDITRQKHLEENLARKDKITAMGHLASGVAHEIRNPLNAISMIAQRFKVEFEPASDVEEYKQLSETMVKESRRINDIVHQFLEFARPAELSLAKADLSVLFKDVETLLKPQAEHKGLSFLVECDANLEATVDADKLKQVLLNLVRNGMEASKPGGKISMKAVETDEKIRLTVQDNGKGIAPEHLDKIFNMYFTTREEGTGLGLSIVQQIISQHNGTIDVESKENQGTLFTIQLPKGV